MKSPATLRLTETRLRSIIREVILESMGPGNVATKLAQKFAPLIKKQQLSPTKVLDGWTAFGSAVKQSPKDFHAMSAASPLVYRALVMLDLVRGIKPEDFNVDFESILMDEIEKPESISEPKKSDPNAGKQYYSRELPGGGSYSGD